MSTWDSDGVGCLIKKPYGSIPRDLTGLGGRFQAC